MTSLSAPVDPSDTACVPYSRAQGTYTVCRPQARAARRLDGWAATNMTPSGLRPSSLSAALVGPRVRIMSGRTTRKERCSPAEASVAGQRGQRGEGALRKWADVYRARSRSRPAGASDHGSSRSRPRESCSRTLAPRLAMSYSMAGPRWSRIFRPGSDRAHSALSALRIRLRSSKGRRTADL
jgi:hypothetical protein